MFLSELNTDEGKNFIELSIIAMNIDNKSENSEKEMIKLYKRELRLTDYKVEGRDINSLISFFKTCNTKVKHIIIIELAGVLYADQKFLKIEEEWLLNLAMKIGVDVNYVNKSIEWIKIFIDNIFKARNLIDM